MENGGKLKTENNVFYEAYGDGNFDIQPKRQVRGVNLSSFRNDQLSVFSNKVFGIDDIAVIHTDTEMAQRYLKK